jgi:hypothetical protein
MGGCWFDSSGSGLVQCRVLVHAVFIRQVYKMRRISSLQLSQSWLLKRGSTPWDFHSYCLSKTKNIFSLYIYANEFGSFVRRLLV